MGLVSVMRQVVCISILFFHNITSGSGESYSLRSTDVGEDFVSHYQSVRNTSASGLNGNNDAHGEGKPISSPVTVFAVITMNSLSISELIKGGLF